MPHATDRYNFEHKLWSWAEGLHSGAGFVAILGADGVVALHVGENWSFGNRVVGQDVKVSLTRNAASWIFYDPFEAPEHAFLEWRNVPRATLEHLLGEPFRSEDLSVRHAALGRTGLLEVPSSWSVMF